MKPFCINEKCENFLPEDQRGYYKKKTAEAEQTGEALPAGAPPEPKTAAKKPSAKKTAAKKATAKKSTAKKTAAKSTAKKTTTRKTAKGDQT